MQPSRATDGYHDSPLSRRAGVRTPSWVSWISQDEQIQFPTTEPTRRQRFLNATRNGTRKVLCLPSKPLPEDNSLQEGNLEMASRHDSSSIDPIEAWKTKTKLLEAEIERLNKKLDDLRRDYRALYTRAQHSDSRSAHFEWKFDQVREAYEDLSRVVFDEYGKEEFRALKRRINEKRREVVGNKGFLTSTTALGINTPDKEDNVDVA